MKIRHEYIILFFGVLISTTIWLVVPTKVMFYENDGEYYQVGTGEIMENIDPDRLTGTGTMYVDGGPMSGSYDCYTIYTTAGRIAYWTLLGSILLSGVTFVYTYLKTR